MSYEDQSFLSPLQEVIFMLSERFISLVSTIPSTIGRVWPSTYIYGLLNIVRGGVVFQGHFNAIFMGF